MRQLALDNNQAGTPDLRDNPEWMRWNNLSIAYRDQLQYAEAMQAFGEVVKLRPDYADHYTNLGLRTVSRDIFHMKRTSSTL